MMMSIQLAVLTCGVIFFTVDPVFAYANNLANNLLEEKFMRRILFFLAIVFSVLFVMACIGTPGTNSGDVQTGTSVDGEAAGDDGEDESLLLGIYDDYNGIVLDGAKEYSVKSGDTLSNIAKSSYGQGINGYYFPLIMIASKVVIADPDKIKPGQKLMVPDLQKNLDDRLARSHLKALLLDIALVYNNKANRSRGALKVRNEKDRDGLVELSRSL
jgi:hypothetical protein